jgi:hypothetical protein
MTVQTDITRQLDELEQKLPAIPAQAIRLGRATIHRVNDTACAVAERVSGGAGRTGSVARTAAATTVGQARSGLERTTTMARRASNEAVGQARYQAARTVDSAEKETKDVLADAVASMEPVDLTDLTKAELYERAQELDIDGRSEMNKSELRSAVAAAGNGSRS